MDHGLMVERLRAALEHFARKRTGQRWTLTLIRVDGHEDAAEVIQARSVLDFVNDATPGAT